MSDTIEQTLGSSQADGASDANASSTPSAPAVDVEAITAAIQKSLDQRIAGLQSSYDKRFGELAGKYEQLKTAGLTPEEQEQLTLDEQAMEFERLRMENQVLRARKDHPDAVDFFIEAMSQGSFEDQIAYIESKLGKAAAAAVVEAVEAQSADAGEAGAAPVDANNPSRKPVMGTASALEGADEGQMTAEMADAILANAPKGALSALRRLGR